MRTVALLTWAIFGIIGCSSPVSDDDRPEPDPSKLILVFGGRQENAPICDPDAELLWEGWTAWSEAPEPDKCEPCECTPAACVLQSRMSASPTACPGSSVIGAIGAGSSWDGTCAQGSFPIRSGSYASVTFEPPTLADCSPVSSAPAPSRKHLTFVRACSPGTSMIIPTDFRQCYLPQPNGECWRGNQARFEFPVYSDTRTCTPCSCGAPTGGRCSVLTTLYGEEDCSSEVGSVVVSDKDPTICTNEIEGKIAAMRSGFTQCR
ncbi:uncharacterized protein SOCE26_096040 [Sorangium cellulosum]|uniref:Uncharacterized protein n=1 Tax=Sorangium cellulosum TaxID=56 RepID=A0A2L0F912_SORCE|nr:uncharacterized protein SOCE26_096040 [Sorangium cellulosum]